MAPVKGEGCGAVRRHLQEQLRGARIGRDQAALDYQAGGDARAPAVEDHPKG